MIRVFTSAAPNYLGKVRTLFASLRKHHPELALHLVLADRPPAVTDAGSEGLASLYTILDLDLPRDPRWLFSHSVVELCTAVKGPALRQLLALPDTEGVLYFDPDIVVHSRLDDLLAALRQASVVLTPHLLDPESQTEAILDNEICALQHGTFNLGFLGVRNSEEGLRFARWWGERLTSFCWADPERGLFTDQKWIDLAPCFFTDLAILRDNRFNVAPWNVSRRRVVGNFDRGFEVDGKPLGFYHFSGFDSGAHDAMIGKYAPGNRALQMLADWYHRRPSSLQPEWRLPWRLASFDDGTPVEAQHRVIYRRRPDLRAAFPDPYLAHGESTYLNWLRSEGPLEYPDLEAPAPAQRTRAEHPAPRSRAAATRAGVRRPANLHLLHSWGGGLQRWVRLFARADRSSRNLVFSSVGTLNAYGLEHALWDAASGEELQRWTARDPICEIALENAEHTELLRNVIAENDVQHVYVSSLIGHALDALAVGPETTLVHHDYFPFCPAINLHFGSTCRVCFEDHLRCCLQDNPHSALFRGNSAEYWLEVRERYFALLASRPCAHVCPTEGVAAALRRIDRRFADLHFATIAHGLTGRGADCFGGAAEERPLRLVVLGRVNSFKGLPSLRALLPEICLSWQVTLLGSGAAGDEFRGLPGLEVIEEYAEDELSSHLHRLRPDLALFASDVPETYSFTLSETVAHAIPACCRRLGALQERVEHGATGLLYDSDGECLELLASLDRERRPLRDIAARLRRVPVRTAVDMVADYYALRGVATDVRAD